MVSKFLSAVLLLLALGMVGSVWYAVAKPAVPEKFTEFYILGPGGVADGYPTIFVTGKNPSVIYTKAEVREERREETDRGKVILGIVNREQREMTYRVEVVINEVKVKVWLGDEELDEIGPVVLPHEGKWEHEIGIFPELYGEGQKLEFRLYKDGQPSFSETLYLWVDVR